MDIQVLNVSKKFDQNQVLHNINLHLKEGKISVLMGPSGRGKTTLINLMMGLMKPDQGEIRGLKGKRVAAVFQEDRLIEHLDAVFNVKLVCNSSITLDIIEKEFEKVGLTEYQDKPVASLSGGMRRRVAIVRAILADSDIIILDEPFKGLDEELKKKVILYVKDHTVDKTVIVVTHEKEEATLLNAKIIPLM
ncbi:MAG: hypothetical protein K0S47_656 [Herbinix sp.]|jgi:NitT/TauT family transport system ATP-binding protein|nr:hypothetical protein [Herbinix sp.]